MKSIQILSILAIIFSLVIVQSCKDEKEAGPCDMIVCENGGICLEGVCTGCNTGYSGETCQNHCNANVTGVYNVTNGSGGFNLLSYTISKGSFDSEVIVVLTFEDDSFNARGILAPDCSTLAYNYDNYPSLGGVITFNTDGLTDLYDNGSDGYGYEATKE